MRRPRNVSIIPGTGNPKHMKENLGIYDFALSPDEACVQTLTPRRSISLSSLVVELSFQRSCQPTSAWKTEKGEGWAGAEKSRLEFRDGCRLGRSVGRKGWTSGF